MHELIFNVATCSWCGEPLDECDCPTENEYAGDMLPLPEALVPVNTEYRGNNPNVLQAPNVMATLVAERRAEQARRPLFLPTTTAADILPLPPML